jgi:hypothetical protein
MDLKAPQMRTEQKTSLATSQPFLEQFESPDIDVEAAVLSVEQIDTIKRRRREAMILPKQVTPADRASQRSSQIGLDGAACLPRTHKIIDADRIEQGARGWTSDG